MDRLIDAVATGDDVEVDLKANRLTNHTRNESHDLKPLGDVLPIIEAGDIFEYAKQQGMGGPAN